MTTLKAKKSQGWASDTDSESEDEQPPKAPVTVAAGSYKEIITGKPLAPVKSVSNTADVPETNDPKGLRNSGLRGGYRDDGPRGGYRDDGPRGGYRNDGPRGGFRDDGPRGGYRDDGPRGGYRDDGPRGGFRDNFAPRAAGGQDVRGSQFDRSRNAPGENSSPESESLRQLEQARLEREMLEKKRLAKLQQKEAKANMALDQSRNNAPLDAAKEENSRTTNIDRGGGPVLRDYIDRSAGNKTNGPVLRDYVDRSGGNKTNGPVTRDHIDRSGGNRTNGPVTRDYIDRNAPSNKIGSRDVDRTVNTPISIMKPAIGKEESKWERARVPVQKTEQTVSGTHSDQADDVSNAVNKLSLTSSVTSGAPYAKVQHRPMANTTAESASTAKRPSLEDSAEAVARKQMRDKARAERGPRTKGFLYKYNEHKEIVEVVTVQPTDDAMAISVDSSKNIGKERGERRTNSQRETLTNMATNAISNDKGGHYKKKDKTQQ